MRLEDQNVVNNGLVEPLNFTDPKVMHDPTIEPPHIIRPLVTSGTKELDSDETVNGTTEEVKDDNNNAASNLQSDAILYPLLQINSQIIESFNINKFELYFNDFIPKLYVEIIDNDKIIQNTDTPGLNNFITVIIIPPVNYTYKSIALDFKITSTSRNGSIICYCGEYKFMPFNKKYLKEIVYNGCNNKDCNSSAHKQPNTWEYLHAIATECGLGFSSTDQCQKIEDRMPRLMQNVTYKDFITKHLLWSGLDEETIFDAWIDPYGYIVMVNVAWLLKTSKVESGNLALHSVVGMQGSEESNTPEYESKQIMRNLTNMKGLGTPNNMMISNYKMITNNLDLLTGTSLSLYNFDLLDVSGGNNAISQYDIEVIQESLDGIITEEYAQERQKNLVIECNSLPINKQKIIRNKFFSKHRQRILEVELETYNLGLQRGTLVNVSIFEDNTQIKTIILNQSSNLTSLNTDMISDSTKRAAGQTTVNGEDGRSENETKLEEGIQVLNPAISGIYYIDSMRFEYQYKDGFLKQFLNLIKRGSLSNLSSTHQLPKLN